MVGEREKECNSVWKVMTIQLFYTVLLAFKRLSFPSQGKRGKEKEEERKRKQKEKKEEKEKEKKRKKAFQQCNG